MIIDDKYIEELFEDKKSQKAKWKKVKNSFGNPVINSRVEDRNILIKKKKDEAEALLKRKKVLGEYFTKSENLKRKIHPDDLNTIMDDSVKSKMNRIKRLDYKNNDPAQVVRRRKKALDLLQQRAKNKKKNIKLEEVKPPVKEEIKKKLSKNKKIAIGAGVTLAAAGALYKGRKHLKKKKENNDY
jgi:hypothetical protein